MAEIGAVLDIGGSMAQWQEKMLKGKDVGAKAQSITLTTAASSASVDAPAHVTASALGLNPAPAFVPVSSTYSKTMGRLTGHLPPPPSSAHLASNASNASLASVKKSPETVPAIISRPPALHERPILNGIPPAAINDIVLSPIAPVHMEPTMNSTRSEVSLNEKVKFERQRTLNEIENAALPPELRYIAI